MYTFDGKKLVADLERLPAPLRVAFAAACAERQMPAYRTFVSNRCIGNSEALGQVLEDAWLNPVKSSEATLQQQLLECMALIPQEAVVKPWTEEATYAQNAGMSVAYTLRTRINGKAQEAVWSAQVAYESLDHFVINLEDVDTNLPGAEARVLSHPVVQAELARQHRDLVELLSICGPHNQQLIAPLRERSKAESADFFTVNS